MKFYREGKGFNEVPLLKHNENVSHRHSWINSVLGVLNTPRTGGPCQEVAQWNETFWLQHLQKNLWPRCQSGATHECPLTGTSVTPNAA